MTKQCQNPLRGPLETFKRKINTYLAHDNKKLSNPLAEPFRGSLTFCWASLDILK